MKLGYQTESQKVELKKINIIKLTQERQFFVKGSKKEVFRFVNSNQFKFVPTPFNIMMEKKMYHFNKLKLTFYLSKELKIIIDDDELPPYTE